MMKRPLWLGVGMVAGVVGTLWAEQRVRRTVDQAVAKLTPSHMANEAASSVRQFGDRVRAAVDAGREERDRREAELWDELDGRRPSPPVAAGPDRHPVRARHAARGPVRSPARGTLRAR